MLPVDHGIIAGEFGDQPGVVVWDWATASAEEPVLYVEMTVLRKPGGSPDDVWNNALVRSIGGVRTLLRFRVDHQTEYGLFRPRDRFDFIHMCSRCRGQLCSALVLPTAVDDREAVEYLEHIHTTSSLMTRREMSGRSVARAAQRLRVDARWTYLTGWYTELPPTIFMSDDANVVCSFARHAEQYPSDYDIRERW